MCFLCLCLYVTFSEKVGLTEDALLSDLSSRSNAPVHSHTEKNASSTIYQQSMDSFRKLLCKSSQYSQFRGKGWFRLAWEYTRVAQDLITCVTFILRCILASLPDIFVFTVALKLLFVFLWQIFAFGCRFVSYRWASSKLTYRKLWEHFLSLAENLEMFTWITFSSNVPKGDDIHVK